MKRSCPEISCKSDKIVKDGFYFRRNDSRKIQRLKCSVCSKKFSYSTGTLEFAQKKRRVNFLLLKLFCSKVSQRRAAKIVGVNKNTVARKFDYWANKAELENQKFNEKLAKTPAKHIQFDDLITKEKTKLKPLSVTVAVDANRKYILCAEVSQIAAFGYLAKISRKKYGLRKSNHIESLNKAFSSLTKVVGKRALIQSDEHRSYEPIVGEYFPKADYFQYKSEKGCIAGQGELKKVSYDPIFQINHTLAVMRDSISTMVRRSWCCTQDPDRLHGHLQMFMFYYNQYYLGKI